MNTNLKLAWRNIWRNRRRTLITAASIFFAVLFSSLMIAIQKGGWDKMVDNVVNFYFGYAQVHQNGYWDDQTINKAFSLPEELSALAEEDNVITGIVPRLESFALASAGKNTSGVLVVGTDPERENAMTKLQDHLVAGEYFSAPNEEAVIVAEGIAENMKLAVGDTLVLISQGYRGVNAAGKYPIKGILKFGSPDLNKQMVYLPLPVAQYFYGANDLLTSVAIQVDNRDDVDAAVDLLKTQLDTSAYEVMNWEEMMPELVEAREVDSAGNYIILFILYIIIAFGIFGTILMMTKEREYEFGVLVSVGMRRLRLGMTVWLEILIMGLIGALAGILGCVPLVYYFKVNPLDFTNMGEGMNEAYESFGFEPIFPAAFEFNIFFMQAVIVFVITSILAIYPLMKIFRLKPVKAMRD